MQNVLFLGWPGEVALVVMLHRLTSSYNNKSIKQMPKHW